MRSTSILLLTLAALWSSGCETTEPVPAEPESPDTQDSPVVDDTGATVLEPGQLVTLGRPVEGHVLGPGRATYVVGASVDVFDSQGACVASVTTDGEGSFRTDPLSPDRYTLEVKDSADRYFPKVAADVDPTRGPVEIELERAYFISGAVVEKVSRRSARGLRVVASTLPDRQEIAATLSGSEGAYRLGPLPLGRYSILVDTPGGTSRETQLLDDVLQLDLTIPDVIYANGVVTRSRGERAAPAPLSAARVDFEDARGAIVASTSTNQDGIFTVAAPPAGSYVVRVQEPGGEGHGEVMFIVPETGEPQPIRILVQGPAAIGGQISFPAGAAAEADVRVWLLASEEDQEPLQVAYPAGGSYRFPRGISPGTYVVRALIFLPTGEISEARTVTVAQDEQLQVDFEFR